MDQKVQLIGDWLKQEYTIKELSQFYEVSRKTIYKWIDRYEEGGLTALEELISAPHNHPNTTPPEIVGSLINIKLRHQSWGPKKVVAWLERHNPGDCLVGSRYHGSILKKEGLVKKRQLKRHTPPYSI